MKVARFCIIIFALLCGALATAADLPDSFVSGRQRFYDLTELVRRYGLVSRQTGDRFQYFFRQNQLIEAKPRSIQLKFNGIKFALGEQILSRNHLPYISATDWNSTLRLLLNPRKLARHHKVGTIILDPGHGGNDQGAAGKFSLEKNLTLKIARRTAQILHGCGYRVLLTRTTDRKIELARRAQLAKNNGGDIFVSIHINSAVDSRVRGIETFCLTPPGQHSSNDRKRKGNDTTRLPGNEFDANNLLLAANIHRNLITRTRAEDRGVKRARFAVLRDLAMPGVLVELGFISNREEERKLNSAAYIEQLARAIANGIIEYQRTIQKR